jgi:hypothetical protein
MTGKIRYYTASIIAGFIISVISTFLSILFNLLKVPNMFNYLLYLLVSTVIYIPIVLVFTAFILNDLKRITKIFTE